MFRCIFCNEHDENDESVMAVHQAGCKQNPNRLVTAAEFEETRKQIAEIHAFLNGIAGALNNPMVKAMIPPQMRGMLPDGK